MATARGGGTRRAPRRAARRESTARVGAKEKEAKASSIRAIRIDFRLPIGIERKEHGNAPVASSTNTGKIGARFAPLQSRNDCRSAPGGAAETAGNIDVRQSDLALLTHA